MRTDKPPMIALSIIRHFFFLLVFLEPLVPVAVTQEANLFKHTPSDNPAVATLKIEMSTRSPHRVSPFLYGKFTEHLGQNIYNGIDAQILTNPTFGKWHFSAGDNLIDGGFKQESDIEKITAQIKGHASRLGLPDSDGLLEGYRDGAAWGWMRLGSKEQVTLSPDVGPFGGRAQRFEVTRVGQNQWFGLFQWIYLPLHRTQRYQFRIVARAARPARIRLSLAAFPSGATAGPVLASEEVVLKSEWSTSTGLLKMSQSPLVKPDGPFAFMITAANPANVVVDRVLLYPDDHVNHADPDVIRLLREAGLPLMRWPGGNFASGYHWRDGVGPVDQRPTRPNHAWGGLEYNLFGTDEFVALCRTIGCQPMICVNAGDGTPEEAAAWVEYCNGSKDTAMGRLRAAHGYPEPFGIQYWEIGNEIYGRWQITWTTPDGNLDRYLRFYEAMKSADPSVELPGCGERAYKDSNWNNRLIAGAGPYLRIITDHILTGGTVDSSTNPHELFQAFLGFARQLGREYRDLRERMLAAGIQKPRLAITELQLFASFRGGSGKPEKAGALSADTMPTPKTISEALYDATIIHECIRMGNFVEMLTHSATVNHGGGLDKRKERVWASPSYYGHLMGKALFGGIPVAVNLASGTYSTTRSFAQIAPMKEIPLLDAVAVLSPGDSALTLMLVHRGSGTGPISVTIDPGEFNAASQAEVLTLAGETMHAKNSMENPEHIKPRASELRLEARRANITLAPYSLTRVILKRSTVG